MYAVIGRVKIKPGHEDETAAMVTDRGVPMLKAMPGSISGYWSRNIDGDDVIQHLYWLFDSEANARSAEATALTLREMPDAPAIFISVDVTKVLDQM